MTPEEKANDLYDRLSGCMNGDSKTPHSDIINAAMICVEELITDYDQLDPIDEHSMWTLERLKFWKEVESEIEKLR